MHNKVPDCGSPASVGDYFLKISIRPSVDILGELCLGILFIKHWNI